MTKYEMDEIFKKRRRVVEETDRLRMGRKSWTKFTGKK